MSRRTQPFAASRSRFSLRAVTHTGRAGDRQRLLCAVMAWFPWSPLALGTAVFLFVVGIPFLQQLAKRDPKMVEIAFRFSRYHRHYPAYVCRRPERRLPVKLIGVIGALAVTAAWWWL